MVAKGQNLLEEKRRQEARQVHDAAIAIYEKLLGEAIKVKPSRHRSPTRSRYDHFAPSADDFVSSYNTRIQ